MTEMLPQALVLLGIAAVVCFAVRKGWETTVIIFGLFLLIQGCDLIKVSNSIALQKARSTHQGPVMSAPQD